jgi:hypothetical protein
MMESSASEKYSLCMKCRGFGHKFADCTQEELSGSPIVEGGSDEDDPEWMCSRQREQLRERFSVADPPSMTCPRCTALNLPSWLSSVPPFLDGEEQLAEVCDGRQEFSETSVQEQEQSDGSAAWGERTFRTLGAVEIVEFDLRCGLCRCLFDLCPAPDSSEQSITLVLSWTMLRLEEGCNIENAGMMGSSRMVTVVLEPFPLGSDPKGIIVNGGDGLVIAHAQLSKTDVSLGSKTLDPGAIDTKAVREWLEVCTEKHQTYCARKVTESLALIRLIDVETRTIVPYSSNTQEFLTLSYVWGKVDQSFPGAGILGSRLPTLHRTLEHAITLTIRLGFRYIWIDSVCINQEDSDDKQIQIAMMKDIYRGSLATLVALSADDANSGMPRVSECTVPLQMCCEVDGVVLRTIGPALTTLMAYSSWNSRAWTYQEARLSARCIFVSNYGVHFECNSMQCLEALDISRSVMHTAVKDDRYFERGSYTEILNIGLTRNPIPRKIHDTGDALNIYSILANQYSPCQITDAADRLLAFSGLLQLLQEMAYGDGFFWGLPREHINWAMSWQAEKPNEPQNLNFPSWTWLRHMGFFWAGGPAIGGQGPSPESCPFDLEFGEYSSSSPSSIRTIFSQTYADMPDELLSILPNDPLATFVPVPIRYDLESLLLDQKDNLDRLLFFDGFALEFAIDRRWEDEGNLDHSLVEIDTAGHTVEGITTYDPDSRWCEAGKQLFLLLARHVEDEEVVLHNMILLKPEDQCYSRADMLRLHIPVGEVSVLRELGLHRLSGVLI